MKAPLASTLLLASIISAGQAAIIGFNEDFTGATLDPAWNTNGSGGALDAANGAYSITNTNGGGGTKLSRNEGGTLGDYTHIVTLGLNSFMGTGADVKWKTFGPDGFTEIVFNSFGNVRQFHTGGNLYTNAPITVADGDTLSFKQVYTLSTNTMDVSQSTEAQIRVSTQAQETARAVSKMSSRTLLRSKSLNSELVIPFRPLKFKNGASHRLLQFQNQAHHCSSQAALLSRRSDVAASCNS